MDSALWMGIIFAILRASGNIPVEKEQLMIFESGIAIISLAFLTIEVGVLSVPQDLVFLRLDIHLTISSGVQGLAMKVS